MESIGVGITTRNRADVLSFTIEQFHKYDNGQIKYLVVDDHSERPDQNKMESLRIGDYTYNSHRLGIAKSKNVCIKRLNVDHLFLFDDDCFPTCDGWWEPWLNLAQHMIFANPNMGKTRETEDQTWWTGAHGCCMYFTRNCINMVGGFDPEFLNYGFEHYELTFRIHKAGLTPHIYISPKDPCIWSFDAQGDYGGFKWGHRGCMPNDEKLREIEASKVILAKILSKQSFYRKI